VRLGYFAGGGDRQKRLKTALKAGIDADARASPCRRLPPLPSRPTARTPVKLVNHYGDEVMKVFEPVYRTPPGVAAAVLRL
jgi:adenine-specific DNA-methyltransferase